MFEPNIRGVRRIIDFCLESDKNATLLYVSTYGTVSHLPSTSVVPERSNGVLSDTINGYSASKLVCELIIEDAVASADLHAAILRVGQIAGPVKRQVGMWRSQEWIPSVSLRTFCS
jgi:thioester reductase-like protein